MESAPRPSNEQWILLITAVQDAIRVYQLNPTNNPGDLVDLKLALKTLMDWLPGE